MRYLMLRPGRICIGCYEQAKQSRHGRGCCNIIYEHLAALLGGKGEHNRG